MEPIEVQELMPIGISWIVDKRFGGLFRLSITAAEDLDDYVAAQHQFLREKYPGAKTISVKGLGKRYED